MWRNWYTRAFQVRMSQDLGVRVSPCPPSDCSIPVVHTLRVRVDWVRFPAVRPDYLI